MDKQERCPEVSPTTRFPQQCELPKGHDDQRCLVTLAGVGTYSWN